MTLRSTGLLATSLCAIALGFAGSDAFANGDYDDFRRATESSHKGDYDDFRRGEAAAAKGDYDDFRRQLQLRCSDPAIAQVDPDCAG